MRKILYLVFFVCVVGCFTSPKKDLNTFADNNITGYDTVYVDEFIKDYILTDTFTPEDAAHFDSMNATGAGLYIRSAERSLDTIVNHYHLIFIPRP